MQKLPYPPTSTIWIAALMAALLVAAALVVWRIRRAKTGTLDKALNFVVTGMILALSAEGMYVVLTTKLDHPLPPYLAIVTCAVVEGLLVLLFREATKFNAFHGRPGPYGKAFWLVAACGGFIVALSTSSAVEVFLRLALPLSVAMIHWIKLTAGKSRENTITWLITPTRIAMRLGILTGDQLTLSDAQRQRKINKIVRGAYLYTGTKPESFMAKRRAAKLRKMILTATPEMAEAASHQIALTYSMEGLVGGAMKVGRSRQYVGVNARQEPREVHEIQEVQEVQEIKEVQEVRHDQCEIQEIQEAETIQALPAARPGDAEILETHLSDLRRVYVENGRLTRHAVERVCGVSARPAGRILALVLAELSGSEENV